MHFRVVVILQKRLSCQVRCVQAGMCVQVRWGRHLGHFGGLSSGPVYILMNKSTSVSYLYSLLIDNG